MNVERQVALGELCVGDCIRYTAISAQLVSIPGVVLAVQASHTPAIVIALPSVQSIMVLTNPHVRVTLTQRGNPYALTEVYAAMAKATAPRERP